jgi:glycosyltransferase involved in cell wall biosynthesis
VELAAKNHENWSRVVFHGQVGRSEVVDIYKKCFAGMATLLESPNHINSKPIKIFEYMAAGLPVICSDFPLWREVVAGGECGLVVDPTVPEQIGRGVEALRLDPVRRTEMAERGRMLAHSRYNWESEGSRLIEIYDDLLAH